MMRISMQLLLVFVACLLAANLQAQEVADESVATEITSPPIIDEIGVGTEGYGSPIQSDQIRSGEIYSNRSGYIHPFLSVGGFYTDNLFNVSNGERSDWVTVISPGIWLARPASRQKLVEINTINAAPGGLALSRFATETERRLQTYALYRADIREHDKYSDENRVDHRGEGALKLSLRGGLSLELLDIYEVKADPYGTGGTPSRELDKYTSNLFNVILAYDISPKVTLRADYGNYYLDYDSDRNQYRNRQDNMVSGYVFYRLSPKTSLFVQAELIDVDYDEDIKSDSEEMNYFIGIDFKPSAKTRSRLKVGYGDKEYDRSDIDDQDEWLAEAQIDYFFTPKTSIYLRAIRRMLESDISSARNITAHSAQLGYRQRFTAKLRGEAALFYSKYDYDGQVTIDGQTGDRDDDYFGFTTALGFTPIQWLNLSIGYEYRERDSNFDSEDYRNNMLFTRITAAL